MQVKEESNKCIVPGALGINGKVDLVFSGQLQLLITVDNFKVIDL